MILQGKWRIVELPGYEADYRDLCGPAYILFEPAGGEFAFGCVTGSFTDDGGDHDAIEFDWEGNDEMDEIQGSGWAELQPDSSLSGGINFHNGDDIGFTARRRPTSSTAC